MTNLNNKNLHTHHNRIDNPKGENTMKKNLKKLGALVIAVAMIAALGTTAFAAPEDLTGTDGVIGAFTSPDTPTAQDNAVLLYKEITAYNKDASTVNAPVMEYTYTIAPGSAGKSVKDAGGTSLHATGSAVEVQTKAGIAGATISGSVDGGTTFTAGKLSLTNSVALTTADDGAANKFPLKVDFSGVTWPGAGVYRYVITETTAAGAKTAAGITEGGIAETLYMDVYVKDAATAGQYEIYGYVCFKANNDIDGTNTSSLKAAEKTEGFTTGDSDGSGSVDADEQADKYYTFNVEVNKTLVGDNANNSHQFPFNVDFTNDSVTANILLKQETTTGGGITATVPTASGVSSLDVTGLKLANGAKVKYIGIPVGVSAATTVAVYENNDVTGTVYKSSYKIDDGDASTAKSLTWTGAGSKSDTATLSTITADTDDDVSHIIAFTNTLEQISPTGVVLRVAPYVIILAAGIALFVISRRRRNDLDA